MQDRKAGSKPFQNSLAALAQVAQREAGAEGYAFFRRTGEPVALFRQQAGGAPIQEETVLASLSGAEGSQVAIYLLGEGEGLFALIFSGIGKRSAPGRILEAIGSVWSAAQKAWQYSQLASEVADLETRLMDSKIADRVVGLTGGLAGGVAGDFDAGSIEAISRHVEGVLRPPPARRVLEQLSRELEEEVEERRLTNRAKTILRNLHGMSEEQAHMHLRQLSRRSRRPLREIAVEVIEKHAAGSTADVLAV